jgi:Leucine-rich repeat (LRR) protein
MKQLIPLFLIVLVLPLAAQEFVVHHWNEKDILSESPEKVGKLDARGATNLDSLFQELPKFKNVAWLNMYGLGIEELPEALFDSLPNLTWLDLGKNRLTKLPISFNKMIQITHLGLYANQLTELPNAVYLMELIELQLYDNQLADTFSISPAWKNLKHLNLSGNSIHWISGLKHLRNVERLVLTSSSFKELPDEFQKCKKLTYFHINNNPIDALPKSLLRLPKLWYILLDKTKIHDDVLYEYSKKYPRKTFDDCPTC